MPIRRRRPATPHTAARRLLTGPLPALPRTLDRIAERWAWLPPRARLAVGLAAVVALICVAGARVQIAEARWGGAPVTVLVATADLEAGAAPTALRRMLLPPAAVPPGAVSDVPGDARLAFALPRGNPLTSFHLDPRGPQASLSPTRRAVPLPVEEGWGITAGEYVDVWGLGGPEGAAALLARSRPVLAVHPATGGRPGTALVAVAVGEVGAITAALGAGGILLAHAPSP